MSVETPRCVKIPSLKIYWNLLYFFPQTHLSFVSQSPIHMLLALLTLLLFLICKLKTSLVLISSHCYSFIGEIQKKKNIFCDNFRVKNYDINFFCWVNLRSCTISGSVIYNFREKKLGFFVFVLFIVFTKTKLNQNKL